MKSGQSVCPECGSLRTRRIAGNPWQRVIATLRGQEVIVCGRCGWRGRQFRLVEKGRPRPDAGAGSTDPLDYQALDRAMSPAGDAPPQSGRRS